MKFSFGKQWYNIKTARDIKQTSDYWLMTNGMTMGFFLGGRDISPGIEWHWTNLNNYINLQPGNAPEHPFGPLEMKNFGHGTGGRGSDLVRGRPALLVWQDGTSYT